MWTAIRWLFGRGSEAERAAWREFRKEHLAFIPRVDTVAEEPTRVVVRVRFTPIREPTFYRFYAVDRATLNVELILDDRAYPPSNRLK
jgi:hypothetical protein